MFKGKIPPNCDLTINKVEWSFALCVEYVVDTSPAFNKTMKARRAGDRLVNALAGKAPGDEFEWTDDDRKMLAEEFEAPAEGWCPQLARIDAEGKEQPLRVSPRIFYPYDEAINPAE